MFHGPKFKRLLSRNVISRADNIVGIKSPRRQGRQEKASDNIPDKNTFLFLATLASWRLIHVSRFNYYAD
jgi:hypothetical protein